MTKAEDRLQDREIQLLNDKTEGLEDKISELEEKIKDAATIGDSQLKTGLYAAMCRDYKILISILLIVPVMGILVIGVTLSVFGIIGLADLKEYLGIAKSVVPVFPTVE